MNWPIGSYKDFIGVVDRTTQECLIFTKTSAGGAQKADIDRYPLHGEQIKVVLGAERYAGLLDELDLLEHAGEVPAKQAEVILTTVHKAKGLEFPQVRMVEDFSRLKIDETGKVAGPQEEFNVLYVAATRSSQVLETNDITNKILRLSTL